MVRTLTVPCDDALLLRSVGRAGVPPTEERDAEPGLRMTETRARGRHG